MAKAITRFLIEEERKNGARVQDIVIGSAPFNPSSDEEFKVMVTVLYYHP